MLSAEHDGDANPTKGVTEIVNRAIIASFLHVSETPDLRHLHGSDITSNECLRKSLGTSNGTDIESHNFEIDKDTPANHLVNDPCKKVDNKRVS